MTRHRCCETDMTAIVTESAIGQPQVVHLCLFCDLRVIHVPQPRAWSDNSPAARARDLERRARRADLEQSRV